MLKVVPWVETVVPIVDIPANFYDVLTELDRIHYIAIVDEDIRIQLRGISLHQILDWLRTSGHYKEFGTCSFPSNSAVIGCFYDGPPKLSPVMDMKPGNFHVFTCTEGKINNPSHGTAPSLDEHCLFLHESYAKNPERSLKGVLWSAFNVGGRFSAAMLDFDTFFEGPKHTDKKAWYQSWIDRPIENEKDRVHLAMPNLAAELEPLTRSPTDTLALLMDDLVWPACRAYDSPVPVRPRLRLCERACVLVCALALERRHPGAAARWARAEPTKRCPSPPCPCSADPPRLPPTPC